MYVFIYGTLKNGFSNFNHIKKYIDKNTNIQKVITKYKYPMYQLKEYFPYLENQKNKGKYIKGELFKIKNFERNILFLDEFEGVPDLYKRGKIITINDKKEEIEAYVYFKAKNLSNLNNVKLLEEWIE